MHGWARVVSQPEPGLALLNAGKRDVPFDQGCPICNWRRTPEHRRTRGRGDHRGERPARVPAPGPRTALAVGAVVRLGLSHPCTAFDKWPQIPVVDGSEDPDPVAIDLVRTFF